jgi:MoxR-like ATPase
MATDVAGFAKSLIDNIEKVIVGKRSAVALVAVAALAEGHVLLEDVPGVAKTMLARAFAKSIGCSFKRLQCTPDLLPTDVTGVSVFNPKTTEFEFRPGPIFAQILLTDEINRTTPRTQSALLEAMAERRVSVDGQTYSLKPPFIVLATQNPIDHEGTFPLPEAQLDRFLMRLSIGYPTAEDEGEMLGRLRKRHPIDDLAAVASGEDLVAAQEAVRKVHVDDKVRTYVLDIVRETREHEDVALGGSPRASIALFRAAQALAAVRGRDYVWPDDIKMLAPSILCHRLILKPEARLRKQNAAAVVKEIVMDAHVPIIHTPDMRDEFKD